MPQPFGQDSSKTAGSCMAGEMDWHKAISALSRATGVYVWAATGLTFISLTVFTRGAHIAGRADA